MSCLLLCSCHLFNENPGQCSPARVGVSKLVASGTFSNPESRSHLSLVNAIRVTFNMAVTVKVVVSASKENMECSFNVVLHKVTDLQYDVTIAYLTKI